MPKMFSRLKNKDIPHQNLRRLWYNFEWENPMKKMTLIQPDDWHLHLRDGDYLTTTVNHTAEQFARAIVMPNLNPPITDVASALAYRNRILAACPANQNFQPLMTLYLTEHTSVAEIAAANACPHIYAYKLYPAHATTNSQAGITQIEKIYPILEALEKTTLLLLIHGETVDPSIDVFDREKYFIDQYLLPISQRFPALKIVLEHISTQEAVEFIKQAPKNLAATITAHHLLLNRNDLLSKGIHPHLYCAPILKRSHHQQALIAAATSANPKFFLGTDSAPHSQSNKECAHGCAGLYTGHAALPLYAEIFEHAQAIDKLEGFASIFGPTFYGLPVNNKTITLIKQAWTIPDSYHFANEKLIPFNAGKTLSWKIDFDAERERS